MQGGGRGLMSGCVYTPDICVASGMDLLYLLLLAFPCRGCSCIASPRVFYKRFSFSSVDALWSQVTVTFFLLGSFETFQFQSYKLTSPQSPSQYQGNVCLSSYC